MYLQARATVMVNFVERLSEAMVDNLLEEGLDTVVRKLRAAMGLEGS